MATTVRKEKKKREKNVDLTVPLVVEINLTKVAGIMVAGRHFNSARGG